MLAGLYGMMVQPAKACLAKPGNLLVGLEQNDYPRWRSKPQVYRDSQTPPARKIVRKFACNHDCHRDLIFASTKKKVHVHTVVALDLLRAYNSNIN